MWSCIAYDNFGYGRIPASSAPVESEIKKTKHNLFKRGRLRPDLAVETHIQYLYGRMKLIDAGIREHDGIQGKRISTAPESKITQQSVERNAKNCHACMEDDTTNYSCMRCERPVHILEECSVRDDEGNIHRLCISCDTIKGAPVEELLALQNIENWGGQGMKQSSKMRSLYVGKQRHKVKDLLTFAKSRGLPMLKNGNDEAINCARIGERRITISNTCAFDSIFQIFLAGVCDYPVFEAKVLILKHTSIIQYINCDLMNYVSIF